MDFETTAHRRSIIGKAIAELIDIELLTRFFSLAELFVSEIQDHTLARRKFKMFRQDLACIQLNAAFALLADSIEQADAAITHAVNRVGNRIFCG